MAHAEYGSRTPLLDALMPFPGRLGMALRITAVSVLVVLASMTLKIPETAVCVFLVFFVQKDNTATTILMCIALAVLLPLVVGLVLLLAILTLDAPEARVAAMATLSFGILWLASASKLGPVGNTVGLVIAYGLDLLGKGSDGELVTRGLLYALEFAMLPLAVMVVFNLVFGRHPEDLARIALRDRLDMAANGLIDPLQVGRIRIVALDDGQILKWLRLAKLLHRVSPERFRQCVAIVPLSRELLIDVVARQASGAQDPLPDLAARCRALSRSIETGLVVPAIRETNADASLPGGAIAVDRTISASERAILTGEDRRARKRPKPGFLKPGALSDPDHVRYALKTTAAAMICYLTYAILDWPGIHTCMITCFVGSLLTVGETTRKLVLRLSGCLIGAALGFAALIYVLPQLDGITGLLILLALVGLPCAWIAAGSERISYLGVQIIFAFCLCVLQGFALKTDLTIARDRIIGIVFGDLVTYIFATQLYPVSIMGSVERTVGRFLAGIRWLDGGGDPTDARPYAAEELETLRDQLDALTYESPRRDEAARIVLAAGERLLEYSTIARTSTAGKPGPAFDDAELPGAIAGRDAPSEERQAAGRSRIAPRATGFQENFETDFQANFQASWEALLHRSPVEARSHA